MTSLAERARSLKLRLVAMTDAQRGGDPLRLAAALPAGAWLIFRHYDAPDRSVLAIKLARICRARRLQLLIAGDLGLALATGAGLHLPEFQAARPAPKIRLWRRRGGGPLTVAAHGRGALIRAVRLGADYVLLSPIFATASHPGAKPLGLIALRHLAGHSRIDIVALGGITAQRLGLLRHAGISGVAAIGALNPAAPRETRYAAADGGKNARSVPAAPA
jgi:thiamine-phosphate pyrophosphorylase